MYLNDIDFLLTLSIQQYKKKIIYLHDMEISTPGSLAERLDEQEFKEIMYDLRYMYSVKSMSRLRLEINKSKAKKLE